MISFEPTEDQKLMQQAVAQFAKTVVRPRQREFEKLRGIPDDVRAQAHDLGLATLLVPESAGGPGLGMTTAVLVEEELAWGDAAVGFGLGGPGAFGLAIAELGSEEQIVRFLKPFADAGANHHGAVAWGERKPVADREGLATTAVRDGDGYRIDGTKAYVVGADRADSFVVFAQVDASAGWDGVGAFVVKRGTPGLSVGERKITLGLDAASFGGITLEGVRVSAADRLSREGDFTPHVVRFFAKNALLVAARGVGLSRAAFEVTRDYCDTRKAFGKPIGHFQAVAFTLADRAIDLDAARALVWRAATAWDTPGAEKDALLYSARAISFVNEAAMRAGDDAVQLHGGSGFIRDYPVEKYMRDAKQLQLCAMTSSQADQLAAAIALGAPLRIGAVVPTAESQSAFV